MMIIFYACMIYNHMQKVRDTDTAESAESAFCPLVPHARRGCHGLRGTTQEDFQDLGGETRSAIYPMFKRDLIHFPAFSSVPH